MIHKSEIPRLINQIIEKECERMCQDLSAKILQSPGAGGWHITSPLHGTEINTKIISRFKEKCAASGFEVRCPVNSRSVVVS